jgi:hypothetical protein
VCRIWHEDRGIVRHRSPGEDGLLGNLSPSKASRALRRCARRTRLSCTRSFRPPRFLGASWEAGQAEARAPGEPAGGQEHRRDRVFVNLNVHLTELNEGIGLAVLVAEIAE